MVENPIVILRPPTNEDRVKMIHSLRCNRNVQIKLTHVPDGKYTVYTYLWEDNNPEIFSISLQGEVIEKDYYSGLEGQWRGLDPWVTTIADDVMDITSSGWAVNFSGIKIWQAVKPYNHDKKRISIADLKLKIP